MSKSVLDLDENDSATPSRHGLSSLDTIQTRPMIAPAGAE